MPSRLAAPGARRPNVYQAKLPPLASEASAGRCRSVLLKRVPPNPPTCPQPAPSRCPDGSVHSTVQTWVPPDVVTGGVTVASSRPVRAEYSSTAVVIARPRAMLVTKTFDPSGVISGPPTHTVLLGQDAMSSRDAFISGPAAAMSSNRTPAPVGSGLSGAADSGVFHSNATVESPAHDRP